MTFYFLASYLDVFKFKLPEWLFQELDVGKNSWQLFSLFLPVLLISLVAWFGKIWLFVESERAEQAYKRKNFLSRQNIAYFKFCQPEFFTEKVVIRLTNGGIQNKSVLTARYLMIEFCKLKLVFARVNPNKLNKLIWEQTIGKNLWTIPIFSKSLSYLKNSRSNLFAYNLRT